MSDATPCSKHRQKSESMWAEMKLQTLDMSSEEKGHIF